MEIGYLVKEARYYRKVTGLSRAIKRFLLIQTPMKKIVNSLLYSWIYGREIRKKTKLDNPSILQIENTNFCNARCIMCPHVSMKRKQRTMTQEEFEKIIDNVLSSYKIKRIVMNGFGEPFVDKGAVEKIEYVNKKYPSVKVDMFTNGALLDKQTTDKLLKTKLDRITFSINGTKKNYHKIMQLNYDDTMKNVMYFLTENRRRRKRILTNISLMILDDNTKDIKKFIKFWSQFADSVRFYPPNDWAGGLKNIIYKTPFSIDKRWPCIYLWNNITVDVNGNLTMCCRDYESKVIFGNLLKQDIRDIRNSIKFKELQDNHLKHNFIDPVCNVCDIRFESSLDWICESISNLLYSYLVIYEIINKRD